MSVDELRAQAGAGLPPGVQPTLPSRAVAWYLVGVLMLCYTLAYADRQILAFLVAPMKHDLHISDSQVGVLQGFTFALVYTVVGLPMGVLADRFSRRNIIALGVLLWSVMTSLSSIARSFASLAAARMGVGIGEATVSPCAFSMIGDAVPKERLSTALSIYTMGIQLGSGLALVIGGVVSQAVSQWHAIHLPLAGDIAPWRVTFLIVGTPGLLVTLVVLSVREPTRRTLLLDATGRPATLGLAGAWQQIRARWRSVLGLGLMMGFQATCNYTLLAWGPSFFERVHHWPKDRIGLVLGGTSLGCGCLGLLAGGWLADRWQRRGTIDASLRVGLLNLAGVLLTLAPATLVSSAGLTVALLVPAVFCVGLPIGCGYAALQLIFPNQVRGLASALVILAVALIGLSVGAGLPGWLNDHWFHDELRVGTSMALTVAGAAVLGMLTVLLTLAPYRADYRAVHAR
ncbi:MAG TPA: MFS transporter [Steroidobacteraceae bacterium]|nr:MFS transporter [Steroidobacteraceae bacterium]